jgi:hypothetical protein
MAERRKLVRSRVLKNAKFIVDASLVIDCFVRNLTVAGAQVELPRTAELPDRLTMTFDSGRTLRSCRIVWRDQNKAGLEFVRQG